MSKEILLVVEFVLNEKGVEKDVIFEVIELVFVIVVKKWYEDEEVDIWVVIDCWIGEYEIFCCWFVVDNDVVFVLGIEFIFQEVEEIDIDFKFGDMYEEKIEFVVFGCIGVQVVKQIIFQKVCEVECIKIVDSYCDWVSELVLGIVKKVI